MKATIEIPDELYRRVKAKSAIEGRRIRDVTMELYERWLKGEAPAPRRPPQKWLQSWLRLADETFHDAGGDKSARQILTEGRGRLEPR